MRVLHVIDGIDVGGAELVLVQLIERLQAAGHRNTVLVLTSTGALRARLVASGAELVEIGLPRGRIPTGGLGRMAAAVRAASPDVVQGWMYHGNLAATVLKTVAGTRAPVVWSVHNTLEPFPELPRITRLALHSTRALSGRPACIVYVSRAAATQHESFGFRSDRTRVIPNGTDCGKFRPRPEARSRLRYALGVPGDAPLLGTFARWHPMKGHPVLFEALGRLRASGRPVHVLLAGTGMSLDNPGLAASLAAAGLADTCSCLGERHDVEQLMAGLDAFVLPSVHGEAFPLVLGEAMATEVPCIATDVGDCRLILGETGEVVAPGDAPALAAALDRMLSLAPEARARMGRLARQRIERHFSIDAMGKAYEDLYRSLLPGTGIIDHRALVTESR